MDTGGALGLGIAVAGGALEVGAASITGGAFEDGDARYFAQLAGGALDCARSLAGH